MEETQPKRTKLHELSILTIGLGVILAALTLWLVAALPAGRGEDRTEDVQIALAIAAVFVTLGVLLRFFKSKVLVLVTATAICAGFLLDLVLYFNLFKSLIELAILTAIVVNVRQTLRELTVDSCKAVDAPEMADSAKNRFVPEDKAI